MMHFENLSLKKYTVFEEKKFLRKIADVICNCIRASISDYILVEHSLPSAAEALQGHKGAQVLPYLLTTLFPEVIFLEKQPCIPSPFLRSFC